MLVLKPVRFVLITLAVGLVSACNSYSVTYATFPEGATLFCQGTNEGRTPVTLTYDKKALKENGGRTAGCNVRFVSGYEERYNFIIDLNRFPNGVMYTITRPNTDGYTTDALFAAQLEQQRRESQIDWDGVAEALQRMGDRANGRSSGRRPPSPSGNINNYLIRTEEVIGARICHYQDGSAVRIGGGSVCSPTH